ncbi:MAG: tRNA (adenosine(37)-N6)-threonylcarbamoyltransferase complex dimerization subunit type 1 TsaB [Deltaproteobacteria bacterium]|nr:tRNA (adenosine(37)-N6)-threonylcarbamoyltransferase complex dimerization subunit type 1 TsaB [Deltaproteobacteria bacterium]
MINPNLPTLALDCSVKKITPALIKNQLICASYDAVPVGSQSGAMMGVIDNLLKQGQTGLDEIKNVIFCNGPGSFTSLRVGLATLMGLFWGRAVGVTEVSSLLYRCYSCLDFQAAVIISTVVLGRNRFAVGILDCTENQKQFEEKILSAADLEKTITDLDAGLFQTLDHVQKNTKASLRPVIISGLGLDAIEARVSHESICFLKYDAATPQGFVKLLTENPCDNKPLNQCRVNYMLQPDLGLAQLPAL